MLKASTANSTMPLKKIVRGKISLPKREPVQVKDAKASTATPVREPVAVKDA